MPDYYVQVRKGGAWHYDTQTIRTLCGRKKGHLDWLHGTLVVWDTSDKPQHRLCKRCERIAGRDSSKNLDTI